MVDIDERIYNCKVHVDGDLGVARTPNAFYENVTVHHIGTNIFYTWKAADKDYHGRCGHRNGGR